MMNNLEFVRKLANKSRKELDALRLEIMRNVYSSRNLDEINILMDVFKDDNLTSEMIECIENFTQHHDQKHI